MSKATVLHLEDVVFRYFETGKRNILDHVSLDIEEGGITILMGSSGCGKSTLAAVSAGLYPENGGYLESGGIELYGKPVSGMDQQERAAYLTLMFQNPDLQFCMDTLRKEMQFCMENICVPKEEMDDRIRASVKVLDMEGFLDRKLTTLSGGEKQKAALCCLHVMNSKCILLDEAFANIDQEAAMELIGMLRKMKDQGTTIIAIDHQLGYWAGVADEIIVLGEGGRVLQRGICRENLAAYYPLFEKEGLFYLKKRSRKAAGIRKSEAAVLLQDVSIQKGTDKRRLKKKLPEDALLSHAGAEFPKGAMTAVLGSSGCGKTTTFLSILKQHPYEGLIEINGTDLRKIKKKELFGQAGIVFQNPSNQFITQNVEEEVKSSIRIWDRQLSEEKYKSRSDELLRVYGLERYHRYSPYMLSQGQQRRLAVLSVLAGSQKILFLDEPTYGQDYRSTMAIMEQLRRKVEEEQLTVVFITHDVTLAYIWADKIYCLENKKLVERRPEELEVDVL